MIEYVDDPSNPSTRSAEPTVFAPIPTVGGEAWILSFCDPDKPKGTQYLGGAVVEIDGGMVAAVLATHLLGINPGGEVQGVGPFPSGSFPRDMMDRLLTADEVQSLPPPSG